MELWKSIKGFEGYQISNKGRVKSFKMSDEGNILAGGNDKDGYRLILLYRKGNKRVTAKVHRLVAEAFIPNPENKPQVNHLNGKRADNHVDNLEWATGSENIRHSFRIGLKDEQIRLLHRPVNQLDMDGNFIKRYESLKQTIEDGFHRQTVGKVCRGERRHHKGFRWEYAEPVTTIESTSKDGSE